MAVNQVPKFGNWGTNDQVQYTTVFDNARAGKGGKTINAKNHVDNEAPGKSPEVSNMSSGNSAESMPRPAVRHQRRASRDGSEYGFSNARLNHGHRRAASRGEEASFAQTERVSNYDRPSVSVGVSPIHANAGGRLGRKPGSASPALDRRSDGGGTPGTPSRSRAQPERHASPLPKFGEWDVNNPSTAEEFTFIFDKARDEKKTGKAFRMDSPLKQEQVASKNQHGNHESTSWFCRCFQPSTTA